MVGKLKIFRKNVLNIFLNIRASGTVYKAVNNSNKLEFAMKRIEIEQQSRKDLIVSEIESTIF